MTEQLTKEDCSNLQKLGRSYELFFTDEGVRWLCAGLESACFPTTLQALKNLANYAGLGELSP